MNCKKPYFEAITAWRPLHSSQDFSLPVSQNAAGTLNSPAQPCSLHSPLGKSDNLQYDAKQETSTAHRGKKKKTASVPTQLWLGDDFSTAG